MASPMVGLGNQDLTFGILASANVGTFCHDRKNPALFMPGEHPATPQFASLQTVAGTEIKGGNFTFPMVTFNFAVLVPTPESAGCPNDQNWTVSLGVAHWTAQFVVYQLFPLLIEKAVPDEALEMLARAGVFYYEAEFSKSIELVQHAEELLRQSGDMKQKTDVKLLLALSYVGLNDMDRAKTYLDELFALDPERHIDPVVYPPKFVQLADEAKRELNERRCQSLLEETTRQLASRNGDAVLKGIESSQTKCPQLATVYADAADLLFKEGLAAYKQDQMGNALPKFQSTLRLEPDHQLAGEYIKLAEDRLRITKDRLEVAADRAVWAWRQNFNAGEYTLAARDYRDLTKVASPKVVDEVRDEYTRALSSLVDSWTKACAQDDTAQMDEVRARIHTLIPEPSFGQDMLTKMTTCTHTACLRMNTEIALARLKTRVDPQFASFIASQVKTSPVTVRMKIRVNEQGDVVSGEPQGGNPLLYNGIRAAMDRWKFYPAVKDGEPRCVDTEIPITINFK